MNNQDLSRLNVDGVICISLIDRQDRRDLISHQFKHSGLNIEFMLATADTDNPERGCFDSHIKCARLALERGYRAVLILEDDATLLTFSQRKVTQINNFMRSRNPDLIYLGATLGKVWLTWQPGIARYRAKGAFAYVLTAHGCKKMLQHAPFSGLAIDQIFSKRFKAYGVFPMLCQHQPESLAKSNILHYRSKDGTAPGVDFWQQNWRRQFYQVFMNFGKTLIRRDL